MTTALPPRFEHPRITRIIYDHQTGKVVHVHHAVVLPGVNAPGEAQLDAFALALASRHSKRSESDLKVMTVKPEEFEDGTPYRVHLETNKLEKIVKGR